MMAAGFSLLRVQTHDDSTNPRVVKLLKWAGSDYLAKKSDLP